MCGFLTRIIVTYAYICFSDRSNKAYALSSSRIGMLPYLPTLARRNRRFGSMLDARLLSMLRRSTGELLRTL